MRIFPFVVGVLAVSLSACGGGGSKGSSPVPQSNRPVSAGDSFSYVGTLSENMTRFPEPNGPPSPTPVQTNAQTYNAAVTQQVAVSGGATFNGASGLFDFKTTESDVQASPSKTLGLTTDAYYAFPANGAAGRAGKVILLGSSVATTDGATFLTTYGSGNGLVDVLPETAGALAPANNAARAVKETDPDGQVTTRTTNADGSYVETAAYPDGSSATATENADGSGTYSFPLFAVGSNTTFSVGAVAAGGTAIPITIVYAAGTFSTTTPVTVNRSIAPVWYPKTPPLLASETYVNNGVKSLPAACNVPRTFGSSANELVQTITKVDTLFGEIDTFIDTTYTIPGVGVACVVLGDIVDQYYDFSGQTARLIGTYAAPIQITTTNETLGLTAETLAPEAQAASLQRTQAVSARAISVATADFGTLLERLRLQRHALAHRRLLSGGNL